MKMFKLLFLCGLILVAAGAGASQISVGEPEKTLMYHRINLTDENSTVTFQLGELKAGARIRIDAAASTRMPYVLLTVVRTDTKEPIPDTRFKKAIHNTTFHYAGSEQFFEYDIPATTNYIVLIEKSPKPYFEVADFPWISVRIRNPPTFPYMIPGIVIIVGGLAAMIVGLIKRKA